MNHFCFKQTKLSAVVQAPGDKSISHRAVILASMAMGTSKITGLLEGEDVLSTLGAMRALGADIGKQDHVWQITGVGPLGFSQPKQGLDLGNSGTSIRLIMGAVAAYPFDVFFSGDDSLSRRPMARVAKPLALGGAVARLREGRFLPLHICGSSLPLPIEYESPVASAQIKSALLLYGLNVTGTTTVIEPRLSRNHSEIMLKEFGAELTSQQLADGRFQASLDGVQTLRATDISVAGDISSAAFMIIAALIVKDSEVTITNVGLNHSRTGLLDVLWRMGADIAIINGTMSSGEQVGDLRVRYSELKGIEIEAEIAPRMIDEYPILAVVAAFAKGPSTMLGLKELTVKESNRLLAIARGLAQVGVECEVGEDWLVVTGTGKDYVAGISDSSGNDCAILTEHDHRIAMSFLVMGLSSLKPIYVDCVASIATSFPDFFTIFAQLGVEFKSAEFKSKGE